MPGVGPRVNQMLRLALGPEGYPAGDTLRMLRDVLTADEALELEAVSLRRRDEVGELSRLRKERAEVEAKRDPKGGR